MGNEFQTLFDMIGELARRRYLSAEKSFASLGLNHTEARLLALLHQNRGSAGQDQLSAMLTVDRTNAGRALHRLEQAGYIACRKNDHDKRANVIRLTEQGRRIVGEIGKLRKKMVQGFFGDMTQDDARVVAEVLGKALTNEAK